MFSSNIDIGVCYDNFYDIDGITGDQYNRINSFGKPSVQSRGMFEADFRDRSRVGDVAFVTNFLRKVTLSDIQMISTSYDPADAWFIQTGTQVIVNHRGVKLYL